MSVSLYIKKKILETVGKMGRLTRRVKSDNSFKWYSLAKLLTKLICIIK